MCYQHPNVIAWPSWNLNPKSLKHSTLYSSHDLASATNYGQERFQAFNLFIGECKNATKDWRTNANRLLLLCIVHQALFYEWNITFMLKIIKLRAMVGDVCKQFDAIQCDVTDRTFPQPCRRHMKCFLVVKKRWFLKIYIYIIDRRKFQCPSFANCAVYIIITIIIIIIIITSFRHNFTIST